MSAQTYNAERDLSEARAMVDALDHYVRGEALYGHVGGFFGSGQMPSLTIGALLLRLHRLHALRDHLSSTQQNHLDAIQSSHDAVRNTWRVHYDQKMVREARSRLESMRRFFEECVEDPRVCPGNYPPELLRRTIVQELAIEIEAGGVTETDNLGPRMRDADAHLRRFIQPADFQWPQVLRPVYSQDVYWWLYARPPVVEKKK